MPYNRITMEPVDIAVNDEKGEILDALVEIQDRFDALFDAAPKKQNADEIRGLCCAYAKVEDAIAHLRGCWHDPQDICELRCIVNELDGDAVQTLDDGPLEEVLGNATDAVRRLINQAIGYQEPQTEDIWVDGETHTVRVIVQPDDQDED